MIILGERKFIQTAFDSEEELEQVVFKNAELLFGPSTIYLPKSLISTHDGFGTIPDGFVVDLSARQWYMVDAELSKHSVWGHIAPQIAKQLVAATNPSTKERLINLAVGLVRNNEEMMEMFTELEIHILDVRQVLGEIIAKKPIIGMPIDGVSNDLREWAGTIKVDVRLWTVRKLVEFGKPENVMYELPENFKPTFETQEGEETADSSKAVYDVSLADLIQGGILEAGDKICMTYKARKGEKKSYEGTILKDGSIEVLGKEFPTPSYAAFYAMKDAGTSRKTVNGWIVWKTSSGELLSDLREKFLKSSGKLAN
jgi:hypothetical protein